MNVCKMIKNVLILSIVAILSCACDLCQKSVQLTDKQKESIEIICQNVESWSGKYLDSGENWPVNHIYRNLIMALL